MRRRVALFIAVVATAGCGSAAHPPVRHPHLAGGGPVVRAPVRPGPVPRGDREARADGVVVAGGARCGRERWDVKTATDAAAAQIDVTPQQSSVAELAAKPSTNPNDPDQPRDSGVESHVFTVTGTLVAAKEEADSDFHLVLDDGRGHTMIAEIPDAPACTEPPIAAQPSALEGQIESARASFVREFGQPSATQWLDIGRRVTVTGVGFFDVLHGQRGVAPNGVELHPVVAIADP